MALGTSGGWKPAAVDDVTTHGDRHVAIDAPKDGLLVRIFDVGDLRKRNGNALARINREVADMGEVQPLLGHGAGDDRNLLDAVAHRRDWHPGDQHAQRLRDVLRRQPQRPHAVLIDHEFEEGRLLVPVEMGIDHLAVGTHYLAYLVRDVPDLPGVRTDDAELDGKADGGPEVEWVDAHARLRQRSISNGLFQPRLDPLARLDVLRQDDDLGEGFVWELWIEPQPEAGRALPDIGCVGRNVRIVLQQGLGLFHRLEGPAECGAGRHAKLEE